MVHKNDLIHKTVCPGVREEAGVLAPRDGVRGGLAQRRGQVEGRTSIFLYLYALFIYPYTQTQSA